MYKVFCITSGEARAKDYDFSRLELSSVEMKRRALGKNLRPVVRLMRKRPAFVSPLMKTRGPGHLGLLTPGKPSSRTAPRSRGATRDASSGAMTTTTQRPLMEGRNVSRVCCDARTQLPLASSCTQDVHSVQL